MFIVANTVSNVIDKMRERQIVTTTNARKIAMGVGKYLYFYHTVGLQERRPRVSYYSKA